MSASPQQTPDRSSSAVFPHSADGSAAGGRPQGPVPTARFEPVTAHLVVALVALVVIGGATRVMEAGLACPDWPLCYGQWLPGGRMNLQVFLEWFHRLDAFVVGVALLVLSAASWLGRRDLPPWLPRCALGALLLVAVQGGLGALTVTRLLAPGLVTAHLATALLLVALLSGLHQALERQRLISASAEPTDARDRARLPLWWRSLALLSLALVLGQCLLGGSLASQWAAQRCLSAAEGCQWLLRHRLAATPAALTVAALLPASLALPSAEGRLRWFAAAAALLAALQVCLGVATLRLQLGVPAVTVSHQLVAALLIAVLGAVVGRSLQAGSLPPQRPAAAIPGFTSSAQTAHG
ncbi:heme A synthase [Cyanobium sp. CH-040]|uniref:COX15/CtaA family protein n=1 Tax=Cyanobium sp. CH-040 TaxID=2823708 RepID=UPI0020CDF5DC|nr:COX15/CtaA family protein [Cyanobium sp. CH-040]MCP9926479.1 COX15/CtaA family protein [Cyanobium sp. CH-040]